VGPVLVALLAWVAKSGNLLLGFTLLFVYALGLGILFIAIGTFVGVLTALPRAGNWMETVKHIFGGLLIAGAILILRPLLPGGWNYLIWGIFFIFAGVMSGAIEPLPGEAKLNKYLLKSLALIVLIVGALFFNRGLSAIMGWNSGMERMESSLVETPKIAWIMNDLETAFSRAQSENKPVVMDFYADWCVSCVEMEEKTWVDPRIVEKSTDFIFLRIDLTKPSAEMSGVQRKYNVQGLPTVILFDKDGRELNRFSGFKDATATAEFLIKNRELRRN
jgi:thiol:disulfide interchange protein DsbD